jgi:hypothetical protein
VSSEALERALFLFAYFHCPLEAVLVPLYDLVTVLYGAVGPSLASRTCKSSSTM